MNSVSLLHEEESERGVVEQMSITPHFQVEGIATILRRNWRRGGRGEGGYRITHVDSLQRRMYIALYPFSSVVSLLPKCLQPF